MEKMTEANFTDRFKNEMSIWNMGEERKGCKNRKPKKMTANRIESEYRD